MNKIVKSIAAFVLVLSTMIAFQSCETLDQEPLGQKDIDKFFITTDDALNALTGAYGNLRRETFFPKNFMIMNGISTDDCDQGGQNEAPNRVMQDLYTNNGYDNQTESSWYMAYNVINRAGMVVDKTPSVEGDESLKSRIIGEARFLRSMVYFYLARTFGDVPFYGDSYVDDPAGTIDQGRTSVEEIYDFIEEDLLKAIEVLPVQRKTEKGRASKGAAQAFLAKMYLTRAGYRFDIETETMVKGDSKYYEKARDMAKQIIDEGEYQLEDNYVDVFSVDNEDSNSEAMFFINAQAGLEGEMGLLQAGMQYLFRLRPKANGWSSMVPELELYYAFDTINDLRINGTFLTHVYGVYDGSKLTKPDFDPPYTDENAIRLDYWWSKWLAPRPHINKYLPLESEINISSTSKESSNNQPLIRYSDVLLIFAEADNEVNNGPSAEGEAALDQVRNRAGLGSWKNGNIIYGKQVSYSNDYNGFSEAIQQERRLELCFELNRRYDLIRWNKLVERIQSIPSLKLANGMEVTEYDNLRAANIREYHNLFPLPQIEVDKYQSLVQNPGF